MDVMGVGWWWGTRGGVGLEGCEGGWRRVAGVDDYAINFQVANATTFLCRFQNYSAPHREAEIEA